MKRSTLTAASAALAASLFTATPAEANPAATTVAYVADAVLGEALGLGGGLLLNMALGGTGANAPITLSAASFEEIDRIVTSAVEDGWFANYEARANTVSEDARDYLRSESLADATKDASDIRKEAAAVANLMRSVNLRGVPTYMLLTAIELAFIKEQAEIDEARGLFGDAAGEWAALKVNASDGLAHLDAMQHRWEAEARGKYPIGAHRTAEYLQGNRQYVVQRACFDVPGDRVCSDTTWTCSATIAEANSDYTISDKYTCGDSSTPWAEAFRKRGVFLTAEHRTIFGDTPSLRVKLGALAKVAEQFSNAQVVMTNQYDYGSGWRVNETPRLVGDVNGDGLSDFIAISRNNGINLHLANGGQASGGFDGAVLATHELDDWPATWPRVLADVNADGRDDLIGFGGGGVWLAYSNGNGFNAAQQVAWNFGESHGWRFDQHVRDVADVNGDGIADIVGFGAGGVEVALGSGGGFYASSRWIADFSIGQGWSTTRHVRRLADVNGDGRADVVGFGDNAVLVSLSNGAGFEPPTAWAHDFLFGNGWRTDIHERRLADVNGDGLADIVAFGDSAILVALSNGTGFDATTVWGAGLTAQDGWYTNQFPRMMGDFDGDGAAEPIAFGYDAIVDYRATPR